MSSYRVLCRVLTRYSSQTIDNLFCAKYGVRVRRVGISAKAKGVVSQKATEG